MVAKFDTIPVIGNSSYSLVWFSRPMQQSDEQFLVEDEHGSCTIDPRKSEIITELYYRQQHWYRAIFPGQKVYVLGQLTKNSKSVESTPQVAYEINH